MTLHPPKRLRAFALLNRNETNSQRRCDWRVIVNGRLDRALHEAGRLDRSLPFEELRRISYINEIAETAPEEGFGDYLRREIERVRHGR